MAADTASGAIEGIRHRFNAELDAALVALTQQQRAEVAAVQAASQAEIERRVMAATADADARLAAAKAATEEAERRTAEAVRAAEAEAERRVAAAKAAATVPATLATAFREIDAAESVGAVLTAIERAAASAFPSAALYVGTSTSMERWTRGTDGAPQAAGPHVMEVARSGERSRIGRAVIVPLLLGGEAVGALAADLGDAEADAEPIEMLTRYGSARLAAVTAVRTAQAQRWLAPAPRSTRTGDADAASEQGTGASHGAAGAAPAGDVAQAAARYARLLVSEIKLYNEAAVREGRAHRDLQRRLATEIERARRVYDERVPTTVPDRARYFHQELVQILAGGDPSLLG